MGHKKSIGLPGGPNEFLQDITQYISVDGYRRDSVDKTNPVNFIPSGDISMKDVDFPIIGTDNLGNHVEYYGSHCQSLNITNLAELYAGCYDIYVEDSFLINSTTVSSIFNF